MPTDSSYHHIFTGSSVAVLALLDALATEGINPIIKDENESARLAGFGMTSPMTQQVYVHTDEKERAESIVEKLF